MQPLLPSVPRCAQVCALFEPSISLEALPAALQGFLLPSTGACWQRSFHSDDETRPLILTEALADTPCPLAQFLPLGDPLWSGWVRPPPVSCPTGADLALHCTRASVCCLVSWSHAPHWSSLHNRHSSATSLCWFTGWMVVTLLKDWKYFLPGDIPLVRLKPYLSPPGSFCEHHLGVLWLPAGFGLEDTQEREGSRTGPTTLPTSFHMAIWFVFPPDAPEAEGHSCPLLVYGSGPPAPPLVSLLNAPTIIPVEGAVSFLIDTSFSLRSLLPSHARM